MKRLARYGLAALGVAAAVYFGALAAAPRAIMEIAMSRLAAQTGGVNRLASTIPPDATSRNIVKPSPDLAYSICVFDIGEGPVLVSGRPAESYWSMALYAANTDNFHVVNDRATGAAGKRYVLADQAGRARIPPEFRALEVIEPPSRKGIMLQRFLAPDPADMRAIRAAQAEAECRRL